MSRRRRRNDRGAVAVMFALLAVLFMSMAALGVDLGNAWQQKRDLQEGSDMSTLAGAGIDGNDLPAPDVGKTCSYVTTGHAALATDPAVVDIARYVASNAYGTTVAPTQVTSATVSAMATQLTDCDVTNGEVFYGIPKNTAAGWTLTYNKNQVSLVTPPKRVDFGFARILGFNKVNVQGQSTVEIRSPKISALPFYAFNGCDYGEQTLQQPNNGQAASTVLLANPTDPSPANTNTAILTSVTPSSYPVDNSPALEPITINVQSGSLNGTVTDVGFFESGNGSTGPAPVTTTNFTVNAAKTQISLPDIPTQTRGVAGVQEYWYIRVKINGQWSKIWLDNQQTQLNTPILTIGTPPLVCAQGSSSGNFGTLLLSHSPYTGTDNIGAANVALGLTNTLAIYPPAGAPADGTCSSAQPQTVLWGPNGTDGTNCVATDTGMSSKVASGGFLGLGSSAVGGNQYLMYPNHKTTCANGGTTEAISSISGQTVNNDTLTCFFVSGSTHISDVDADPALGGYTGTTPLITKSIYDSPRFGYVPVLNVQPANGGSNNYQIVDFRACFITDQPPSAVKGDGPGTPNNGFVMDNNGVHSVQVVFLNPNALPSPPVKNGTINYIGSGAKIPLLVN